MLIAGAATAQEVVSDELIYNRVTGFMESADSNADTDIKRASKNQQTVRWSDDLRIGYGAPGLVSWMLLDQIMFGCGCGDIGPQPHPDYVNGLHRGRSPERVLSTLSLEYNRQLKPWLALGCKATYAASWQYVYDTMSGERLYSDNMHNITAMFNARFSWLRRENVEMYSSVSLGLMQHLEYCYNYLTPMFDTVFVGISVGRSFYGFAEVGAGIGGSVRAGVGFRFNGKK